MNSNWNKFVICDMCKCFKNSNKMAQCIKGHNICKMCCLRRKVKGNCPFDMSLFRVKFGKYVYWKTSLSTLFSSVIMCNEVNILLNIHKGISSDQNP